MKTPATKYDPSSTPVLAINLSEMPALLDVEGVKKYIAPIGKTLLYDLSSRGEIETASLGLKRGKRVFVASSIVKWIQRRMATTKRPQMTPRNA